MKHALVWCLLAMGLIGFFCTDSTLPPWRDASAIEQQLQAQKELAGAHQAALFAVFRENLAPEERDALRWLYAYMPLSDLADYDGDFYLRQVRACRVARTWRR